VARLSSCADHVFPPSSVNLVYMDVPFLEPLPPPQFEPNTPPRIVTAPPRSAGVVLMTGSALGALVSIAHILPVICFDLPSTRYTRAPSVRGMFSCA